MARWSKANTLERFLTDTSLRLTIRSNPDFLLQIYRFHVFFTTPTGREVIAQEDMYNMKAVSSRDTTIESTLQRFYIYFSFRLLKVYTDQSPYFEVTPRFSRQVLYKPHNHEWRRYKEDTINGVPIYQCELCKIYVTRNTKYMAEPDAESLEFLTFPDKQ